MSDTDKTTPWWVRLGQRPGATALERHDHRFGACDLPDLASHDDGPRLRYATACVWVPGPALLYGRDGGCGCALCTGRHARRRRNKQDRRQVRSLLAHAARTGEDDPDVPTRRSPFDW